MTKLYLYFHNNNSDVSWVKVDAPGSPQQIKNRGNIEELISYGVENDIILLIPTEDVLLTQVKMPKLSRSKLRQALPFALEDQLLSDLDELHFAIGEYQIDGTVPVAIVAKSKMEMWLARLKTASLFPKAIVPYLFALPIQEKQWHASLHDNMITLRTDNWSGLSGEKQNFAAMLDSLFSTETHKPEAIHLTNYDETGHEVIFKDGKQEHLENILHIQPASQAQFCSDFIRATESNHLNLLQAPYQVKQTHLYNKKTWLAASYLILGSIGMLFFNYFVSFVILHHRANTLDVAINAIYKQHFPYATAVVAPEQRMKDKLHHLTAQAQHNSVLLWLAYIANSHQKDDLHIQQLDFHDKQLTLDISAPNFDDIDMLAQPLNQKGLFVKQQNVTTSGAQVKGTLIITEGKNA